MGTNLTENYFEYDNQKYFRGNAHLVEMGTYGKKKDPIDPKVYLDPQNKVKREHLDRVTKADPLKSIGAHCQSQDLWAFDS